MHSSRDFAAREAVSAVQEIVRARGDTLNWVRNTICRRELRGTRD